MKLYYIALLIGLNLMSCSSIEKPAVLSGLDRIAVHKEIFSGRRIGLVTNHTAYTWDAKHIIERFSEIPNVTITALFGPEHGIRGDEAAGHKVDDTTDASSSIRVYSLYGVVRKPTAAMLENVDMLVFDIQDIGARYYTYISTLALAMEAAAENGKPFVILDRPNPINGIDVEGNVLEPSFASFVGMFPVPVRHGMTAGELARMINGEKWLTNGVTADLTVVKMSGWERQMWYDETGLTWRAPSPNMPDLEVASIYPGTCLFEGTNISEGRGTYRPFLLIGAPWLSLSNFDIVNRILDIPGLHMGPVSFVPRSIKSMAPRPKFLDKKLYGLSLAVTDRDKLRPYFAGIALVKYMYDANPEAFRWRKGHFDRLCGTDKIRRFITDGKSLDWISAWLEEDVESFYPLRSQYMLY